MWQDLVGWGGGSLNLSSWVSDLAVSDFPRVASNEVLKEFERVCRRQQLSNITLSTWSIRSHLVASKRDDQLARRSQNVCYVWTCFVIIKLFFLIITKCVWMKNVTFMELCKKLLYQKSNAKLLEEHVTKVQTNQTSSLSESLQIGTFCLLFLRPFLGVFWKYRL